jgi:hypothetical protein
MTADIAAADAPTAEEPSAAATAEARIYARADNGWKASQTAGMNDKYRFTTSE